MTDLRRNLIEITLNTTTDELNCGECFDLLDQYVDLLAAGQNPSDILPNLSQHLYVCDCCRESVEALLVAVNSTPED